MTALHIAWIVSTSGAILFFAAGFLLARRNAPELVSVDDVVIPPPAPPAEEPGVVAALHQELGQLRTELRARAIHEQALTEQVVALQTEVRELRSRPAPTAGRPLSSTRPPSRPPTARPDGRFTSDDLAALLDRVSGRKTRTVALADELGLPIVGSGDDVSALAAFAAYVADIGRKSRVYLPLGGLTRITLEDDGDAQVTAFPHDTGTDSRLILVSLTSGAGPSTRAARDVLHQVVRMIQ